MKSKVGFSIGQEVLMVALTNEDWVVRVVSVSKHNVKVDLGDGTIWTVPHWRVFANDALIEKYHRERGE